MAAKAGESGAKYLLLSYMRGHIPDMEKLMSVCAEHDLCLIEDCAHTMGAKWRGIRSGNFGKVAAFSTQTYKHMNSGEGGLLTTNDKEIAARAVVSSGSYMLYGRHGAIPAEEVFQKVRLHSPNYSGRMDQMRAAMLRAQLPMLEGNLDRWNSLYNKLHARLSAMNGVLIPKRKQDEFYVGSSIQFRADALSKEEIPGFIEACAARGVELKWFGDDQPKAFTSRYDSWKYIKDLPVLPTTLRVLEKTIDMRVPLTFTTEDCNLIADIIEDEMVRFIA